MKGDRYLKLMVSLVGIVFSSQVHAYLPPADFVVTHAVKERAGLKNLEWTAKVTDLRNQSTFKETLRVDYQSGKVSVRFDSPSDEPLGGHQTTLSKLARLGRFWIVIGLDPSLSRNRDALHDLEIEAASAGEVRLQRAGRKILWTWGNSSEVTFEKDEFVPVSFKAGSDEHSDLISFQGFASPSAKARVPRTAQVMIRGQEAFLFELKAIKADSAAKERFPSADLRLPSVKEWVSLVR